MAATTSTTASSSPQQQGKKRPLDKDAVGELPFFVRPCNQELTLRPSKVSNTLGKLHLSHWRKITQFVIKKGSNCSNTNRHNVDTVARFEGLELYISTIPELYIESCDKDPGGEVKSPPALPSSLKIERQPDRIWSFSLADYKWMKQFTEDATGEMAKCISEYYGANVDLAGFQMKVEEEVKPYIDRKLEELKCTPTQEQLDAWRKAAIQTEITVAGLKDCITKSENRDINRLSSWVYFIDCIQNCGNAIVPLILIGYCRWVHKTFAFKYPHVDTTALCFIALLEQIYQQHQRHVESMYKSSLEAAMEATRLWLNRYCFDHVMAWLVEQSVGERISRDHPKSLEGYLPIIDGIMDWLIEYQVIPPQKES